MALKAGPGGPRRDARALCADYCSRECQAAAWNGGHKAACKQIRRKQQGSKSSN